MDTKPANLYKKTLGIRIRTIIETATLFFIFYKLLWHEVAVITLPKVTIMLIAVIACFALMIIRVICEIGTKICEINAKAMMYQCKYERYLAQQAANHNDMPFTLSEFILAEKTIQEDKDDEE